MFAETLSLPQSAPAMSDEQLAFFHREGYVVLHDLFDPQDLQPVIDEISGQLHQLAREFVASGKLTRTYEEYDFEHRLTHINRETPELAKAMWNVGVVLPSFFGLMKTPHLLDAVEKICGPEIIASSVYRLRPKVSGHVQSAVPWHQDSGYFEPFCDHGLVLTIWLPLVNANQENGCMWVLPRQHHGSVLRHRQADGKPYLEIPEEALPPGQPVCCPVPKGGALLMSNLTPHASFENKTDTVRWSMDLRYQSAALPTNAKITRLPGEIVGTPDQVDGNGAPVACYPPEPDFLVCSHRRPHEVLQTPAEFLALRATHVARPVTDRWSAHRDSDRSPIRKN